MGETNDIYINKLSALLPLMLGMRTKLPDRVYGVVTVLPSELVDDWAENPLVVAPTLMCIFFISLPITSCTTSFDCPLQS